MKTLIVFVAALISYSGFSQSFVFCPKKIEIIPRQMFEKIELSIVFKDSRVYEKKLKEKCKKEYIFSEFVNCIKRTYPNIKTVVLSENKFDENPTNGKITVKIEFFKYDATFMKGTFHAKTQYKVQIFNFTEGENIFEETIIAQASEFNLLPAYINGKQAATSSFEHAYNKFLIMLEKSLLKTKIETTVLTKTNREKSKAERLRELKALLDENILTQEEFIQEKKKILAEGNN